MSTYTRMAKCIFHAYAFFPDKDAQNVYFIMQNKNCEAEHVYMNFLKQQIFCRYSGQGIIQNHAGELRDVSLIVATSATTMFFLLCAS